MTFATCPVEPRVRAALGDGTWPAACESSVRSHVDQCSSCSDLVLVAKALGQSRHAAMAEATSSSAGLIWWRAQLQRRNSAIEQVAKPIGVGTGIALAVSILAVLAILIWQRTYVWSWLAWFQGAAGGDGQQSDLVSLQNSSAWLSFLPVLALLALILFGGFAVYLACRQE